MTCVRCGHPRDAHAEATLFAPPRCLHREWFESKSDASCHCAGYLSAEDAEREAIKSEEEAK